MSRVVLLILSLAPAAYSVLIDQIAITVGNQAITQGQITQDIRLSSLVNGDPPDYSPQSRRKAADRLIEQALVRSEMAFGSYPSVSPADLDRSYASTEKSLGGSTALAATLKQYALTPADLRGYLQWQLALLKFIDLRFRPSVQVTNEDIDKYYRETFLAPQGSHAKQPSLNELRDKIDRTLTGERVDRQVNEWIKRVRSRTAVRYIDASLGVTQNPPDPVSTQPR